MVRQRHISCCSRTIKFYSIPFFRVLPKGVKNLNAGWIACGKCWLPVTRELWLDVSTVLPRNRSLTGMLLWSPVKGSVSVLFLSRDVILILYSLLQDVVLWAGGSSPRIVYTVGGHRIKRRKWCQGCFSRTGNPILTRHALLKCDVCGEHVQ